MANTMRARAASLGASTALVGGLIVLALTATTTLIKTKPLEPGSAIEIFTLPLDPPPEPTERPIETPSLSPLIDHVLQTAPTLDDAPATMTDILTTAIVVSGPVEITHPHWARWPSDLARYYPQRALRRGVEGAVQLDCMVGTSGALSCAVLSETPAGWGFAEAALRIARDHQMAPAQRDGRAVEGRYRMSVPFALN